MTPAYEEAEATSLLPEKSSSQDSSLGERQHAIFTNRLPATAPSDAMPSKLRPRGSTLEYGYDRK